MNRLHVYAGAAYSHFRCTRHTGSASQTTMIAKSPPRYLQVILAAGVATLLASGCANWLSRIVPGQVPSIQAQPIQTQLSQAPPVQASQTTLPQSPAVVPAGFVLMLNSTVDLAPEFPQLKGYELRLQKRYARPGAMFAMHTHTGIPEIINVIDGVLSEDRGKGWVEYGPGAMLVMKTGVSHALANRSNADVVYYTTTVRQP